MMKPLIEYHSTEEYIQDLQATACKNECTMLPTVSLSPDTADAQEENQYIFISYCHSEYKMVYADLAWMYFNGIPFWYDEGLPAGENWDTIVRQRINDPRCAGVIFFISENFFASNSIWSEVEMVSTADQNTTKMTQRRKYFFINLDPTESNPEVLWRKAVKPDSDKRRSALLEECFSRKKHTLSFHAAQHGPKFVEQIQTVFNIDSNYLLYDLGRIVSGKGRIEFRHGAVYDGEFQNGKFDGIGEMTYPDGHSYIGQWRNGKYDGNGKMVWAEGDLYEGQWESGKKQGCGTYRFDNGDIYEGQFQNGDFHGTGTYKFQSGGFYEGQWESGRPHGTGKEVHPSGHSYEGQFQNGEFHGIGTYKSSDGDTYTGQWEKGHQHGTGKLTLTDGEIYEGQWVCGKKHGNGKLITPDGDVYEGEFRFSKIHGHGKMVWADGQIHEGFWEDGQLMGYAKVIDPDGFSYEGQWKDGKRHGLGKIIAPDGTVVLSGRFENDSFTGRKF